MKEQNRLCPPSPCATQAGAIRVYREVRAGAQNIRDESPHTTRTLVLPRLDWRWIARTNVRRRSALAPLCD